MPKRKIVVPPVPSHIPPPMPMIASTPAKAEPSTSVRCALCAKALDGDRLEAHLRLHMDYAAFRCGVCKLRFLTLAQAQHHWRGGLTMHPGMEECLLEDSDLQLEARLEELFSLSLSGGTAPASYAAAFAPFAAKPSPVFAERHPGDFSASARGPGGFAAGQTGFPPPQGMGGFGASQGMGGFGAGQDGAFPAKATGGDWQESELEAPPQFKDELPTEAATEQEEFEQTEEKPDLANMTTPGGCLLCQRTVTKSGITEHVLTFHLSLEPFFCKRCRFAAKTRAVLRDHQKRAHNIALTEKTFKSLLPSFKSQIDSMADECFGDVSSVPSDSFRCGPCDKDVHKSNGLKHLAAAHLKEVIHKCKLCGWTTQEWGGEKLKAHLRVQHNGARPSGGNWEDKRKEFQEMMTSMSVQIYGKSI